VADVARARAVRDSGLGRSHAVTSVAR
jgi:hypothetical protein